MKFSKKEILDLFAIHGGPETARMTGASTSYVTYLARQSGVKSPIARGRPRKFTQEEAEDRRKESAKKWQEKNKEHIQAYQHAYSVARRQRIVATRQKWAQLLSEAIPE